MNPTIYLEFDHMNSTYISRDQSHKPYNISGYFSHEPYNKKINLTDLQYI